MKKYIIIAVGILIVAGTAGYFYFRGGEAVLRTAAVERRNITQEVSVTGTTKAVTDVSLAFETSGRIRAVQASVGKRVGIGEALVELDASELAAQLKDAEAGLDAERAAFEKLKRGARPEEIAIQEVKVSNARTALEDTKRSILVTFKDAYTKADDAVRNKLDQFISNPRSSSPQVTFSTGQTVENAIETGRVDAEAILVAWGPRAYTLSTSDDLFAAASEAKSNLSRIKTLLDAAALAVADLAPSSSITQTTIDSWRADVNTARTNVNTVLASITAGEEKIRTAQSSLTLAENELVLARASATVEDLAAEEAKIKRAEASVDLTQARLAKTVLRSPIRGIITKVDAKVGEIVGANTKIVSLILDSEFQIEINISEADIAKISLGDPAAVTLDAYGDSELFTARVVAIDPAETVVEGVPTYTTTLEFVDGDGKVRSGMTANVDIKTDERRGALALPRRTVIGRDGSSFVRMPNGESGPREVPVKAGLVGSDGFIEILEGVNEGDVVLYPETD